MGSATSFLSNTVSRTRRAEPSTRTDNNDVAASERLPTLANSFQSRSSVETAQATNISPSIQAEIHNHVISLADGRVASQRLAIDSTNMRNEFVDNAPLTLQLRNSPPTSGRHDHNDQKVSIPYTPKGEEAEQFKYYCPLCFQYYKFMWTTSDCCNNHICFPCIQDFLKAKGVANVNRFEDFRDHPALKTITCPHCQTTGFHPKFCKPMDVVRDYSQTYDPMPVSYLPSPLKIGETFEDLKRKMIPFKVLPSIASSSQSFRTSSSPAAIAATSPVLTGIAMLGINEEVVLLPSSTTGSSRGASQRLTSMVNSIINSSPRVIQVQAAFTPRVGTATTDNDEKEQEDPLDGYDDNTERLVQHHVASPRYDSKHDRVIADDELSETVDMLDDSYESQNRLFFHLQQQQQEEQSAPENEEKEGNESRMAAVHIVQSFLDSAMTRVQLVQ